MQIAPGVQAADWQALKLDDPTSAHWADAVQILEGRIHERYIEPIDHLISAEESRPAIERRFGFTVLAVDCLLIETLGAFLDGLKDTDRKSEATFCKFLTTRSLFVGDFTKDLAKRFYEEFRCGILHQAHAPLYSFLVDTSGSFAAISAGKTLFPKPKNVSAGM